MFTARIYSSTFTRVAKITLAVSVITAALVFPKSTWAAVGNNQICAPSSSCTIGEFVYDDSYAALSSASCTITSRYPDGTLFLSAQSLTYASQNDGWYSHTFTTPATTGLYRTEIRCTVGSDVMAIDKTFEVKSEAGAAPTADEVATATWSYSSRTLSSFGSLVADVWNYATRTLTGAGLTSGSLATKSEVESVGSTATSISSKADSISSKLDSLTTTVNNVSGDVTNVENNTTTIIQSLANGPLIEYSLEDDTSSGLNLKIDKSKNVISALGKNTLYAKSKVDLVDNKWKNLKSVEIKNILTKLTPLINTISKSGLFLENEWGWEEANMLSENAKSINISIAVLGKTLEKNGKSEKVHTNIKRLSASLEKLYYLAIGTKSEVKRTSIKDKINQVERLSMSFDIKYSQVKKTLTLISKNDKKDLVNTVNKYSQEVAVLNKLPKVSPNLVVKVGQGNSEKSIRNKLLGMLGIIRANKEMLSKKDLAFTSTWLELGSFVFKTIVTNPSSSISQTVPLKYYLPKEVTRKYILSADEGLEIKFDSEKDQLYISGSFTLTPSESKTLSVRVDEEAFTIPEKLIIAIREQSEKLSTPLKGTSYFAQGVTLKTDIDSSLDKIALLSEEQAIPEEKIRSYREAIIELNAAKVKTEKLKELVASAGSAGTFFGFVGGAQAIAVWGMIVVMGGGFVFLALYMKSLRSNDLALLKQSTGDVATGGKVLKKVKSEELEEVIEPEIPKKKGILKYKKIGILLLGVIIIGGVGGTGLGMRKDATTKKDTSTLAVAKPTTVPKQQVLSETDSKEVSEVQIFVPEGTTVSLYSTASTDSNILASFKESTNVTRIEEKDNFLKVSVKKGKEVIKGWVDKDFAEEKGTLTEEDTDEALSSSSIQTVKVPDDLDSYLKVRSAPVSGEVVKKAYAGDEFPMIDEEDGWVKIQLSDDEFGWVSKDFVEITP